MPIQVNQVVIGCFYTAVNNQLRKITGIIQDKKNRACVRYLSKSINIEGREFDFGHNKGNPPLMKAFLQDCNSKLSTTEVSDLRTKNIILSGE